MRRWFLRPGRVRESLLHDPLHLVEYPQDRLGVIRLLGNADHCKDVTKSFCWVHASLLPETARLSLLRLVRDPGRDSLPERDDGSVSVEPQRGFAVTGEPPLTTSGRQLSRPHCPFLDGKLPCGRRISPRRIGAERFNLPHFQGKRWVCEQHPDAAEAAIRQSYRQGRRHRYCLVPLTQIVGRPHPLEDSAGFSLVRSQN